jgi:hypothetical protein
MSAATGPTADSERAQHYFRHGLAGVGGVIADREAKSRGRERFVGMWHTHPCIEPVPSRRDLAAMDTLLVPVRDAPYRGVLAIFGGRGPLWSDWLHGRGNPTVYAGLYLTSPQQPRVPFVMPLWPTIGTRSTSHLPSQIGEYARRSGQPGTRASYGRALPVCARELTEQISALPVTHADHPYLSDCKQVQARAGMSARSAGRMESRASDTRLASVVLRWFGRSVGVWDPA